MIMFYVNSIMILALFLYLIITVLHLALHEGAAEQQVRYESSSTTETANSAESEKKSSSVDSAGWCCLLCLLLMIDAIILHSELGKERCTLERHLKELHELEQSVKSIHTKLEEESKGV